MKRVLLFLFILFSQFSFSQSLQWVNHCGNSASDKALDIQVDTGSFNIYMSGFYNNSGVFDGDTISSGNYSKEAFLAKLNPAGNFLWVNNCNSGLDDRGLGLTIDPQGNPIYTGTYWSYATFGTVNLPGSADHPFVTKVNQATGAVNWAVQGGSSGDDHGYDMVVDPAGNIYLTGYLSNHYTTPPGTATFGTLPSFLVYDSIAFVAKLNSTGVWQWVKTFGGNDVQRDNDIAIDNLGNVYVCGGYYGTKTFGTQTLTTTGGRDIFVVKYDNNGNFVWVQTAGSTLDDRANGIVIDAAQEIYITGEFRDMMVMGTDTVNNYGGPSGRDIFVAKLKTSGNWVWGKRAGSSGGSDKGMAICTDHRGRLFVTGQFKGSAKFGNDTTIVATPGDSIQMFVAGIDTSGDWEWVMQGGGNLIDCGYGVTIDTTNCRLYACGFFDATNSIGNFGSIQVTSYGRKDGYVLRIDDACWELNNDPDPVNPPEPVCEPQLPNVFTPNGDGVNDDVQIIDGACITQMNWQIFNRWGEIVFESTDQNSKWMGQAKRGGDVQNGVYYYVLQADMMNGDHIDRKGFITVIR